MSLLKKPVVVMLTLLLMASIVLHSAWAQALSIPSQRAWAGSKDVVTLADGQQLAYVEAGNPTGKPLVMIHGYTDNSRSWSLVAPHLRHRHLYMLDLPGHGASSKPVTGFDTASLAHEVVGFMNSKHLGSADIAGHSLGSMTAATLAGLYSDRVEKLVLLSSGTRLPDAALDWLWDSLAGQHFPLDADSPFMDEWYTNPSPVDPSFLRHERSESARLPATTWLGVLRALSVTDWSYVARRIKAPTLILWGDQDSIFDAGSQAHLKQVLPKAQYSTYHGNGHNMLWEQPQKVGQQIDDFLHR
ncbi:alpha/beta fold hydrolase [Carnimonas bestiolae]|uniref:alpha/beta fold hydrolase n=1 Tax=Carnimonas bestiolae TaxID=3402172 RepID=UPI003EDC5AC4